MSMLKTYVYSDLKNKKQKQQQPVVRSGVKHKLETFSQIYMCFLKSI